MVDVKLCIGNKGKSYNIVQDIENFKGKKIHDKISGEAMGLSGYELEITGGSDKAGFPLRFDVSGVLRKKILIVTGVGTRNKDKGKKVRKTVASNKLNDYTAQVNLKVIKAGQKSIEELIGIVPKEAPAKAKELKAEA